MKGLRSFIVLLAVAAGLSVYLYYDSKREPGEAKSRRRSSRASSRTRSSG
jgi:hypothetical protein